MALSDAERALVARLAPLLDAQRAACERLDAYYDGAQRLEMLGLAVPPELRRFTTIVAWPQLYVDSVEERLDVEGFRLPGAEDGDGRLWEWWQGWDGDELSQMAHLDALVYGRSYVTVGARGDGSGVPLVAVESPTELVAVRDPATRRPAAALRLYDRGDTGTDEPRAGVLYTPGATVALSRDGGAWAEVDRDDHGLGVVPVVVAANRPRTARRDGRSQMGPAISLTDACARSLTNLQLAQETHAVPQRYVLGATRGDFVDAEGAPLTAWEAYFGAVWALSNEEARAGQFSASDLGNFHGTVRLYAELLAGMTGLPLSYIGFGADAPASADGIRAAEARLVKTCERRQRALSGAWEQVLRLAQLVADGAADPDMASLETLWRDPATPTRAQAADATTKLVAAGVLPVEAAWEDLGYSASRRARLREQRADQAADPTLERVARSLAGDPGAAA